MEAITIGMISSAILTIILIAVTIVYEDIEIREVTGVFTVLFFVVFTACLLHHDIVFDSSKEEGYKDCLANSKNYTVEIKYKQVDSLFIPCDTIVTKIK